MPHILGWALATGLCLLLARAQVMGFGWHWLRDPLGQGPYVLAGAYLDVLYLIGLCAVMGVVLRLVRRRTTVARLVRWAMAAVAIVSVIAAIANIDVIRIIGQPVNWPWLYYSGFLRGFDAQQAIAASLTWPMQLGIFGGLAGLFCLAAALRWLADKALSRPRTKAWLLASGVVLLVMYLGWASWFVRDFYRPALQNPLVVFACSLFGQGKTELFTMATPFGNDDFRTAAQAVQAGEVLPVANPPKVRNVLIIVLESVAAEYLPVYGSHYPVTPQLDRRRDHLRIYTSIYAHAPNTNKEMVSLLCSINPWPTYRFVTKEHPDAKVITLTDVLAPQGYRTGMFYAADLRFGDAEGFLKHHRLDVTHDLRDLAPKKVFASNEQQPWLDSADDASLMQNVIGWLGEKPEAPFAAVVWTGQTHYPYYNNKPLTDYEPDRKLLNRYLSALSETDQAIGRLLDWLDEHHLADSTLVMVVGDHGEAFGQHNQFGHGNKLHESPETVGAQYGHGSRLYEENVHVPLLLINPILFNGNRDSTVGGMADLSPTVLDLLGQPLPGNWQGRSLLWQARPPRTYFIAPWSGMMLGYREGGSKYLYDAMADRYEMFDLSTDPREQHDLAGTLSDGQRLVVRQRLAAWVQYQNLLITGLSR